MATSTRRLTPEERTKRARLAAMKRHHPDKPELFEDDAREFKFASLEDHIRSVVDSAPPLTESQRERLALLLGGTSRSRSEVA